MLEIVGDLLNDRIVFRLIYIKSVIFDLTNIEAMKASLKWLIVTTCAYISCSLASP